MTVVRCLLGVGCLGLHLALVWVKGLCIRVGQVRGGSTALPVLPVVFSALCFLVGGGAQVECSLHDCHCILQLHSHAAADVVRWQPVQPMYFHLAAFTRLVGLVTLALSLSLYIYIYILDES